MEKSDARLALEEDRIYILWLFSKRCVRCGIPSVIIHEIVPISHGKSSLHPNNRVVLCNHCHDWAHSIGTNNSIPVLQKLRKDLLIRRLELDTVSDDQNIQEESQNGKDLSGQG